MQWKLVAEQKHTFCVLFTQFLATPSSNTLTNQERMLNLAYMHTFFKLLKKPGEGMCQNVSGKGLPCRKALNRTRDLSGCENGAS